MQTTRQHQHHVLSLYRQILRAVKYYPSSNKQGMYNAIREEFRDHSNETNTKKIETYLSMASGGLKRLQEYSNAHTKNSVFWG